MPKLIISDGQVLSLVKQLPILEKTKLLRELILKEEKRFFEILQLGEERFRLFCRKRNIPFDTLPEEENFYTRN